MDLKFRKTSEEIAEIEQQNRNIIDINTNINELIKNSIYNTLVSINSKDLFKYLSILVILIYFMNILKITWKMVFGLLIGIIIVYIMFDKKRLEGTTYDEQLKIKLELIKPRPKMFDEYPELIELFYSIREFYDYNETSFKKVVKNVDLMLTVLKDIRQNIINCKHNVDILQDKKSMALNHLNSMIFTIENNKLIERKLKKAVVALHKILNNYENEAIKICNSQIRRNGYDNSRVYIHTKGPKPSNLYKNDGVYFELQ